MSWLSKSVKKLEKSVKKVAKKVTSNPLAFVNPTTYLGGASIGAPVAAAAGKSGSEGADLGGTAAVLGGAAVSTAGVVGGAELGQVADAGKDFLYTDKARELAQFALGVAKDFGLGAPGAAELDAAASADAAAAFNAGSQATSADAGDGDTTDVLMYAGIGLAALVAVLLVAKAVR